MLLVLLEEHIHRKNILLKNSAFLYCGLMLLTNHECFYPSTTRIKGIFLRIYTIYFLSMLTLFNPLWYSYPLENTCNPKLSPGTDNCHPQVPITGEF